jgi:hypothetical protein
MIWYVSLTSPSKGLRNDNTYEVEYVDLSNIVDFERTKCKDDETIVDGDNDYARPDCEYT